MIIKELNDLQKDAMEILAATSRTFFIPISQLPTGLREIVASAYLCMRAIDEIEDHAQLSIGIKVHLLQTISQMLHSPSRSDQLQRLFDPYRSLLPEVTIRLNDWILLGSSSVIDKILSVTANMSQGMADWVSKEWRILTEEDLNQYTYYVAGLVGVLLSELWKWYENVDTDQNLAVAYGRGLQAVNMIRNRSEDLSRGVDFFPDGWDMEEMFQYARRHLVLAHHYLEPIKPGPIQRFCKIPLLLAHHTLDVMVSGQPKLSRAAVVQIVQQIMEE